MIVTDVEQLTEPVAVLELRESASVLCSPEPVVVRLAPDRPVAADAIRRAQATLRELPTVTVLIGGPTGSTADLADVVDVCLTDEPDPPRPWVRGPVERVAEAVASQPEAAVALVGLLRTTEALPVWAATSAEAATYGMLLGSRAFRAWLDRRGAPRPKPHVGEPVLVERRGDTLAVVLNRPEARNAFDSALRDGLVAAFRQAVADPGITEVRLSGKGPCFSSGGDLHEFGSSDPAVTYAVRLTCHPGLALAEVADRVTAVVHGSCIGAGVEVPAFAGAVVADPDTTFRLPEVGMGLVPGAGGTVSIPRRIGRQRAAWLALTGATIDAPTARDWGLVDHVTAAAGVGAGLPWEP